jgi:preprotein translocase subunit YajC
MSGEIGGAALEMGLQFLFLFLIIVFVFFFALYKLFKPAKNKRRQTSKKHFCISY